MIHKLFTFRLLYNLTKKGYNESGNRVCMHKYRISCQEKSSIVCESKANAQRTGGIVSWVDLHCQEICITAQALWRH